MSGWSCVEALVGVVGLLLLAAGRTRGQACGNSVHRIDIELIGGIVYRDGVTLQHLQRLWNRFCWLLGR